MKLQHCAHWQKEFQVQPRVTFSAYQQGGAKITNPLAKALAQGSVLTSGH
ncbi:hypothetical protein [Pseudomonas protegens]